MTISNFPSRESVAMEIPDQTHQMVADKLMASVPQTSAEVNSADEAPSFEIQTAEDLLFTIESTGELSGLKLSTLTYAQQPMFSHLVHNVLNNHYHMQHKFEWQNGYENAIAPPLPHQWVANRLAKYYEMSYKGDNDKVHQNNIKTDRKTFLPVAIEMANALPEINTAMDIQALLDDAGHEIAGDAISDLLVVYGITIHLLREKQALLRHEKQAKANRAAQAILEAELLQ